MKKLLSVTAIFEAITGITLVTAPAFFILLLLGTSLTEPVGILVCRITGIALLSLAIICWSYRSELSAAGIIKTMLFYNIAASALLVYAGMIGFTGIGIWPVVLVHFVMAAWCVSSIVNSSAS